MDTVFDILDQVARQNYKTERVGVEFYGNRPGTDHQTYTQQAVRNQFEEEPSAIVLGAQTVALKVLGRDKIDVKSTFASHGFKRSGRSWDRRGYQYEIWER
jgi:hypothetical protein